MKLVTLDVETVRDPRWKTDDRNDPDRDVFPNITFHIPVVITYLAVDTDAPKFQLKEFSPLSLGDYRGKDPCTEWLRDALVSLKDLLWRCDQVITCGGRRFDMPLLQLQAKKLGVGWLFWEEMRHRFPVYRNPLRHYDLHDQVTDYGCASRPRLDDLAKAFGLPGKRDIDGGQVEDLWAVEPQRVVDYCLDDVIQTWLLAVYWMELDRSLIDATFTELADRLCWGPCTKKPEKNTED